MSWILVDAYTDAAFIPSNFAQETLRRLFYYFC